MTGARNQGKRPSRKPAATTTVQPLTEPSAKLQVQYPFLKDFLATRWEKIPLRNAFGVYGLSNFIGKSDYQDIAVDSITEGFDDKDVDLCLILREAGTAYIAQCYAAEQWNLNEAPSNKADDLLTGLSWLLRRPVTEIPIGLRKKATELQDAVDCGEITTLYLLYIHNCKSSTNVRNSLRTVEAGAKLLIAKEGVSVIAEEISLEKMQYDYDALTKTIVVEDELELSAEHRIRESGPGWKAVATTVSGSLLHDLWKKHDNKLFSANIRGFLGQHGRKKSINQGILTTVQQSPERFWAYNNGVTALTKKIVEKNGKILLHGISVINGAQTTGVLGVAPRGSADKVRVAIRFIECDDTSIVSKIIDFNNTQNAIRSFDYKSTSPVQIALRDEFKRYQIEYVHRREGASRLSSGAIQAESLARNLAAFHGKFQVATRQRDSIFEEDSIYHEVFPKELCCEHAYLVQCLADALDELKIELLGKVKDRSAIDPDRKIAEFLEFSTSKLFLTTIIGKLAPSILGRQPSSLFAWVAKPSYIKPDRTNMVRRWRSLVEAIVSLVVGTAGESNEEVYTTVRSTERLLDVAKAVKFQVHAIKRQLNADFSPIRDATDLK